MKTKNDFNPMLDSRLVHLDYSYDLSGEEKRKVQEQCKQKLIDDFKQSFQITGETKEYVLGNDGTDEWYYSVTHAKGTTMIMFAKWPIGIDAQHNDDCPNNYEGYIKSPHFNETEQLYFSKHNSTKQFLELWVAKESFIKCYNIECDKDPDFSIWKLIEKDNCIGYTNGTDTYICGKGISDHYTFAICSKE